MEFTNTDFANLEIKRGDKTKTKWQVHGFDKDNSLLAIVHSALLEAGVDTNNPAGVMQQIAENGIAKATEIIESGDVFSIPELIEAWETSVDGSN